MMNTMNTLRFVNSLCRPAMRRTSRNSTRVAGFTLIEIIVAIAIFLIGALAIIRIFPPALGVIQNSENRTIGANLSRGTLATFSAEPNLVPDAVYDSALTFSTTIPDDPGGPATPELTNPDNGFGPPGRPAWVDFNGAVAGGIKDNNSLPKNERALIRDSALGHFRTIVGERHTVLVDDNNSPTNTGDDRKFVLTRYPYTGIVAVYVEDRVSGVKVESDGQLDFSEARLASSGESFHDENLPTANPPGDPRRPPNDTGSTFPGDLVGRRGSDGVMYYVTYRWREAVNGGAERIQGVTDEPVYFPANNGTATFAPPVSYRVWQGRRFAATSSTADDDNIIPGAVDVRFKHRIRFYTASPPSSGGITTNVGGVPSDDFLGVVPLNTNEVRPGQTVSLTYTVKDWRWMVDEGPPSQIPVLDNRRDDPDMTPDTPLLARTLPVRGLDDQQTLQNTWVRSLMLSTPDVGFTRISSSSWGEQGNSTAKGTTDQRLRQVNPKTSQVTFDVAFNVRVPPQSPEPATAPRLIAPRARTIYWTLDRWAQQMTVGARSYLPFYNTAASQTPPGGWPLTGRYDVERERWREYSWSDRTSGSAADRYGTIYFHPSEAGKSILVNYQYLDGTVKSAIGHFTVDERVDPVDIPGFSTGYSGASGRVSRAIITQPNTNPPVAANVVAIISVQGLSTRARTAWLDGGRYTQAASAGYRPLDKP